jgi:Holliday junction resolvase RusA-like endonuclease
MSTLPLLMASTIQFTVYAKPQPQGSSRAFMVRGRPIITSANKNLKPYRQELTNSALAEMAQRGIKAPFAEKHVPVRVDMVFYLERPKSIPKKREHLVVKPDADKLIRATTDSLTGVLYFDDAQIVGLSAFKKYGTPERVEISVRILD